MTARDGWIRVGGTLVAVAALSATRHPCGAGYRVQRGAW